MTTPSQIVNPGLLYAAVQLFSRTACETMPTTIAELVLSAAYRSAQRALSAWLEYGNAAARRRAFAVRAALAALDATERDRLARWLAWLCVAANSHGEASLSARIRRLDATMHAAMEEALARLPKVNSPLVRNRRLSA